MSRKDFFVVCLFICSLVLLLHTCTADEVVEAAAVEANQGAAAAPPPPPAAAPAAAAKAATTTGEEKPEESKTGGGVKTLTLTEAELEQKIEKVIKERIGDISKWKYPEVRTLPVLEKKRILVTGGAGFVGSHLVDVLMKQGHEVIVVDNFFTGRKKNVEHWIGHPNFELRNHDVIKPVLIEVDQIYHLACPASPVHYQYNPIKTIKVNVMGTLNMLGLAKRVKARIMIASTSEVYGDPEFEVQKEDYWGHVNPIGPRACYDEGKRVSETMCIAYEQQSHTEIRIARIFNTFGPRMHPQDGRVVSNFIIQSLNNSDITIYGKGMQTRSFQYVSDLVAGFIKLMNSDYNRPVNLGNPEEFTIKDFAEKIKTMVGNNNHIVYHDALTDDPQKRRPDISLAKEKLGWKPVVGVDKGLQLTIDYFRKEMEAEKAAAKRNAQVDTGATG
eukprot:Nk52_evm3s2622 gene=Nk52_evmTU3s2622